MKDSDKPKTLAQCYEISYNARFNQLPPEMKARVEAYKKIENSKDRGVQMWLREVAEAAETYFDANQPQNKNQA